MKCEGEMKLLLLETGAQRNSLCSALKHSSSKAATAGELSSFSVWRLIPGGSQNHRGTRKESARSISLPSLLPAGSRRLYLPLQCEHSPSSSPAPTWSSAMPSGSVLTSLQMVKPGQWRKFPASAAVRMNDSNVCLFSHLTHCPLPSVLTFSQDTLLIF